MEPAGRVQAHHRRLRLLDFPAQRHHPVRGVLRDLCGAGRRHRRRPGGRELFDLHIVAFETACLLLSSFLRHRRHRRPARKAHVLRRDGRDLRARRGLPRDRAARVRRPDRAGAGPTRSAFLSAFFALIGCHGLHVSAGLLWLLTMMAQVFAKGFRADICADSSASACSGTPSTSSGSPCSGSSTWWEPK